MNFVELEQLICYTFKQPGLLKHALTHRSFAAPNNERLEFIGDSVLNCVIAHLLFSRFPSSSEGVLSRLRANLVCQHSLFELAQELNLGELLLLGDGELKTGGRVRPSTLADALESVLGAIFLDGGFDQAHQVIARLYNTKITAINPDIPDKDAKTLLQEYVQGHRLPLPLYQLTETLGSAHDQTFYVSCEIPSIPLQTHGVGNSRRAAEQAAAAHAWQHISSLTAKSKIRARQKKV